MAPTPSSSSRCGPDPSLIWRSSLRPPLYLQPPVLPEGADASDEDRAVAELFNAALENNLPRVKTLVKELTEAGKSVDKAVAAASVQVLGSKGRCVGPLHLASANRAWEVCEFLVEICQVDVNATDADGATPLMFAIQGVECNNIVKYLLTRGADPNKADSSGVAPLHIAVERGSYEAAQLLLSYKAEVDPMCGIGGTPIHIAAEKGHAKILKLLVQHTANCDRYSIPFNTPLVASLTCPSLECLEILIEAGADVNAGSPVTPLLVAAAKGLTDCITRLLEAGADANIPDKNGKLPVEIAALQGWEESVEMIFPVTTPVAEYEDWSICGIIQQVKVALNSDDKENASSDATTKKDRHPDLLKSRFEEGTALTVVKVEELKNTSGLKLGPEDQADKASGFLASRMSALLSRTREGHTTTDPLDFVKASFEGNIPRLKELVMDKGAGERVRLAHMTVGGLGALQVAALLGRLDVLTFLVGDVGFDVDGTSGELEVTALCCASFDGMLKSVSYLLDHGANPNKKTKSGQAPLHYAARYGHHQVAKELLSRGSEVDIGSDMGSPLHVAAFFGQRSVMEILLDYNADWNLISRLGTPLVAALCGSAEVIHESISLKCIDLLVKAGANVNSTHPYADSPLAVAAMLGLLDCTDYLVKAGADANATHACCGAMPIEIAANSGVKKHVHILLEKTTNKTIKPWTVNEIISQTKSREPKLPLHMPAAGLKRIIHSHFNFLRITDMPSPDIVITVEENDCDPFRYKEEELRDLLANHRDKDDILQDLQDSDDLKALGPHPLLEAQTNSDPPARWINTKFQLSGSTAYVILVMRADNLYIQGFANERGGTSFCYELTEPAKQGSINGQRPQIIPVEYLPFPLHWDVKYNRLLKCKDTEVEERLRAMGEDPMFVSETIRYLASFDPTLGEDDEAKRRLAGLIFKFCEYLRLKLRDRSGPFIGKVRNWAVICKKLREWRKRGVQPYRAWDKKRLKSIGIESEKDALDCVHLVLNTTRQSIDEMDRMKAKKVPSKGGQNKKNAPSVSGPYFRVSDGNEPAKDNEKSAQGDDTPKEDGKSVPLGRCRVQLLRMAANFPVASVNVYDSRKGQSVYTSSREHRTVVMLSIKRQVVDEGLVLTGHTRPLDALGVLRLQAFPDVPGYPIEGEWDPYSCVGDDDDDEPKVCMQSIGGLFGRMIQLTYLLIPNAIEAHVKALLLPAWNDYCNCIVQGTIRAHTIGYRSYSISLLSDTKPIFIQKPDSCVVNLDLSPSCLCIPYDPQLKLVIEVDLTLHSGGNVYRFKSDLKFTPQTGRLKRVDGQELEIHVTMASNSD